MDDVTRLRKCAVWRRAAAISAQPSSSDAIRPATPSATWRSIRLAMLRSLSVARVRTAFSDTFELSPASVRSRLIGSFRRTFSRAVMGTASTDRCASSAAPVAVKSVTSRRDCLSWARTVAPLAGESLVSSSSPSTPGAVPPSRRVLALLVRTSAVAAGSARAPWRASSTSFT